jgi:hypothetical protein
VSAEAPTLLTLGVGTVLTSIQRRLHLTLRIDKETGRVSATFRRLWGEVGDPAPIIRLAMDPPTGVNWTWIMGLVATQAHEVPVPDDFEYLSGEERYELLWSAVIDIYARRSGLPDKFQPHRRKQGRK